MTRFCQTTGGPLILVNYIPGEDNPADLLTKNLGRVKFEKFRSMYGLYFPKKKPE